MKTLLVAALLAALAGCAPAGATTMPACSSTTYWVQQDGREIWIYADVRAPFTLAATITTKAGQVLRGSQVVAGDVGRGGSVVIPDLAGSEVASVVLTAGPASPCAVAWQHVGLRPKVMP